MTNLEGRVIRRRRALPPPDGVLDDLQMMKLLADRLGRGQYFSAEPREVFDELRRASAGGHRRLRRHQLRADRGRAGRVLALPERGSSRARRDCSPTRFPTADGRASFIRVEYREPAETPDADYPYVLTTGRLMAQYQSGTQTRRVPAPSQALAQPEAQLHPDLARRLGIDAADIVQLTSRRGRGGLPRHGQRRHPAGQCLRALPLGRRLRGQRADQPGAGPLLQDAGLQGLRRRPASGSAHPTTSICSPTRPSTPGTRPTPRALPGGTTPPSPPNDTSTHLNQLLQPSRRKDLPMLTQNRFLQGVYPFDGAGLDKPAPMSAELSYLVPDGVISPGAVLPRRQHQRRSRSSWC